MVVKRIRPCLKGFRKRVENYVWQNQLNSLYFLQTCYSLVELVLGSKMSFTFFTLGGKQFWEDRFFYHGWRIQRSCFTGRHRLLDEWDIRRESGTLLRCQNAFIHYIETYQLLRPKQKAVVFLHGYGQTKDKFNKMAQEFKNAGFTPIAINMPTLRFSFDALVEQLDFILKNLKDIQEISFVAYGFGGLILRKLLSKSWGWQRRMKIGRIVIINVPNRGAIWGQKLSRFPILSNFLGTAVQTYMPDMACNLPDFSKSLDIGILNSWNPIQRNLLKFAPRSIKQLFPDKKDYFVNGAKEISAIKYFGINFCSSKKAITPCINFIKSSNFKSSQKIKKL